jgi:hypothetical protein
MCHYHHTSEWHVYKGIPLSSNIKCDHKDAERKLIIVSQG